MSSIYNQAFGVQATIGGVSSIGKNHEVYKAVVPNFLFKPPFGFPLSKNVPEIRRLAKTPFIEMVNSTIVNEVASLDWKIVADDGEGVPDTILKQTEDWFYNPNSNDESLDQVLKPFIRDILELESGVLEKVWNLKGEFVEIYARDGGTFTKNPNLHGVLPPSYLNGEDPEKFIPDSQGDGFTSNNYALSANDRYAYYQYGWLTGARPIPFDRREIVYAIANPRADSIYGTSKVEILLDIIQLLTYGVESNLEYFSDNNIPKGAFVIEGASDDDIKNFGKVWQEALRKKDPSGKWRKYFHKMPVMNKKGEFVRVAFSNLELELIEQQKWFTKIVWAVFGITSSELGFTEDSNRATEVVQSNVFKRKAIAPLVSLIEYQFNTNIINDLPWIRGTQYEGKVKFEFDKFDLQEELAKTELYEREIKAGIKSKNEIREEKNLEKKEGGDDLNGIGANSPFGQAMPGKSGFGKDGLMDTNKESAAMGTNKPLKGMQEGKSLNSFSTLAIGSFEEIVKPEFLKKKIVDEIGLIETTIKSLIKREAGQKTVSQIKAIDNSFIKSVMNLVSFGGMRETVNGVIRAAFGKGVEAVEVELGMNFIPNQRAIDFLQSYTFENITSLGDELKQDLRQELQRGLMNGEGVRDLTVRVDKVMKVGKNRAEMIARTESNRAENMGSLDGYRQSGLKGTKEWVSTVDSKTSDVCKHLDGKKVPLDEKFIYKGEEFDSPPARPNCRSSIVFHPE